MLVEGERTQRYKHGRLFFIQRFTTATVKQRACVSCLAGAFTFWRKIIAEKTTKRSVDHAAKQSFSSDQSLSQDGNYFGGRHKKIMPSDLLVETTYGPVQGRHRVGVNDVKFVSFQAIPYARPPIGELRFKVSFCKRFFFMILDKDLK